MQPQQLPMGGPAIGSAPRFEQVFHQNFRHCDCEIPMVSKKWNEALGTLVAIRLCCLAKAVEKLTGEKLYEVHHFAPRWEWDCAAVQQCADPDGTGAVVFRERGKPPKWLEKRMREKGVRIYNDPDD